MKKTMFPKPQAATLSRGKFYVDNKELNEKSKRIIAAAVKKVVKEYGEALKLLGRE